MNKIDLVPLIQASDFHDDVEEEMAIKEVNTHYDGDVICVDWSDDEFLETKKWLVEFYGEEIKNYDTFAIMPT